MTSIKHVFAVSTFTAIAIVFFLSCGGQTTTNGTGLDTAYAVKEANAATGEQPSSAQQAPTPPAVKEPAEIIPSFTFYTLHNGMRFERGDLSYTGNIVFFFFDPTCIQCQDEARDIGNHYDRIENASLYFVSMNDPALVNAFIPSHAKALDGKSNVKILYDRDHDFINRFHLPARYPSTYVYGPDGKLKTYWNGHRDIEQVLSALNN